MKEHSLTFFVKKFLNKTSKQDAFEFFCTLECNWFLQAHRYNFDYVVLVISIVCGFLHMYYTVLLKKYPQKLGLCCHFIYHLKPDKTGLMY